MKRQHWNRYGNTYHLQQLRVIENTLLGPFRYWPVVCAFRVKKLKIDQ